MRLAGDAEGALPELEAVRADMRAMLEEDPGNVRPLRDLLVVVQDLGDAEAAVGRHEQALAHFREQLDMAKHLSELTPEDVNHVLSIGFAQERMGDSLLELGRADEAIEAYEAALEKATMVRERDLSIGVAHEIVIVVNRKLGELWLGRSGGAGSEEARRAESHLRAALEAISMLESRSITARHSKVEARAIAELLERASR
jgi:tetratricopeptide (TPR) repeat protein